MKRETERVTKSSDMPHCWQLWLVKTKSQRRIRIQQFTSEHLDKNQCHLEWRTSLELLSSAPQTLLTMGPPSQLWLSSYLSNPHAFIQNQPRIHNQIRSDASAEQVLTQNALLWWWRYDVSVLWVFLRELFIQSQEITETSADGKRLATEHG